MSPKGVTRGESNSLEAHGVRGRGPHLVALSAGPGRYAGIREQSSLRMAEGGACDQVSRGPRRGESLL